MVCPYCHGKVRGGNKKKIRGTNTWAHKKCPK